MTALVEGTRRRLLVLGVVVALALGITGAAFAKVVRDQRQSKVPTAATRKDTALGLQQVLSQPHIVFRSTAPGPTYGRLAAAPLSDPGGGRAVTTTTCERVAATRSDAICLQADRGVVSSYDAVVLDGRLQQQTAKVSLNGVPSRTKLSSDGSRFSTTVFTAGHGYNTIGFSTETIVYDKNGRSRGNLEKAFKVSVDGKRVTASDLNVWGVTFVPGKKPTRFYATVATGGHTWLARGDLTKKTLTSLRKDAECPSLSPDGRTVVYKKRAGSPITWRFHVLDLATGEERPLSETRSVDDQAEWLDDSHVMYGVQRAGSAESDVWVADVSGASKPTVLIKDAWSPSVVRTAAGAAASDA